MNRLYPMLLLVLLALGCQQQPAPLENQLITAKMAPSEHLNLRYAYPDDFPDKRAYVSAVQQAQEFQKHQSANRAVDEPWRLEGPGNSGGRINTIAAHPTDADIILVGFSGGGIFKTIDGGTNWNPVFDENAVLAISSIVYDVSNPNILYAGTGDLNISSYPFVGNGIYKSTDGGDTWSLSGLENAGIISRILVDPTDGDIVYAASMGIPFAAGNERGLYKSTDGGANWNKILFLSDITGVIDLAMDPFNSATIYATGWDRVRNTQESIVFGDGAKIHKSTDGGANWTTLSNGLPTGNQCRIGIALSKTNADFLYALYIGTDFQVEGVYQSFDGGNNWFSTNLTGLNSNAMGGFGWYFGQIRVHPTNDEIIYIGGVQLWMSVNGGDAWSLGTSNTPGPSPHVDMHDLQFDADGDRLLATDGGLYKQTSFGGEWFDMENIPATQFYRIAFHPNDAGMYFGGAQDNGTLGGEFAFPNDWERFFGGDGFSVVFHPTIANTFYLETQNGTIWQTKNGGNSYTVASNGLDPNDSKPWDMFFSMSPFDPSVLYTGTQKVYESEEIVDEQLFSAISGDLTESATAGNALRYHYITHVVESSVTEDLLVCGTSDGLVWKRAPGQSWTLINTGLPDHYVTRVIPSESDDQHLFVTHSGYRDNDNTPHIHFSNDQGSSWTSIAGNMPSLGINDLLVLPNSEDSTLIIGTDAGVYFSLDRGAIWEPLGSEMPMVPVYDLALDTELNRFVAGTFARSIYSFPVDSLPSTVAAISIAGEVVNTLGIAIPNVEINASSVTQTTANDGLFNLSILPDAACEITASRSVGDIRNGLSSLDAVLVQRHVIKLDTLSPLKQIAADVNNSTTLSSLDAGLIQRVVIFLDTDFARGNWGFMPKNYDFPDPLNAFSETLPTGISCANGQLPADLDFWGFKIGDLSDNANNSNAPQNNGSNKVSLRWEERTEGLTLVFSEATTIYGAQLELEWQNIPGEIISDVPGLLMVQDEQRSRLSWINPNELNFAVGEALLILPEAKEEDVGLGKSMEALVVCGAKGNIHTREIEIQYRATGLTTHTEENKLTIFPNPIQEEFVIDTKGKAIQGITLFDRQGKLIHQYKLDEFNSTARKSYRLPENLAPGLYQLVFNLHGGIQTEKFIKL